MGTRIGIECYLYRQTTGTRAAWPAAGYPANLSDIEEVHEATLNLEKSEVDNTRRKARSAGWKTIRTGLKAASIEFDIYRDSDDAMNAHFVAIRAAWVGNTTVALAVLDGHKNASGTEGLWADFEILNMSRNEAIEDNVVYTITAKPADSGVAPAWIVVTGT